MHSFLGPSDPKFAHSIPRSTRLFEDVAAFLPRFIEDLYNAKRHHSALGCTSPAKFEEEHARQVAIRTALRLSTPKGDSIGVNPFETHMAPKALPTARSDQVLNKS
jgi:hypothetical protein